MSVSNPIQSPIGANTNGIECHYDTSVASSITTATGVSTIADLSGKGRDLKQATAAKQPVFNGGMGGITFDGVDDSMQAVFTHDSTMTIFMVVKQDNWTLSSRLLNSSAAGDPFLEQGSVVPSLRISGGAVTPNNTDLTVGSKGVLSLVLDSVSSVAVNKGSLSSAATPTTYLGGITLASNGVQSFWFANYTLYEFVAYSRTFTLQETLAEQDHLMQKWDMPLDLSMDTTVSVFGRTITKESGVAAWDAQAYSNNFFNGAAHIKFDKSSFVTGSAMFGMNTDPTLDSGYIGIDFTWYIRNNGGASIFQSGVSILDIGAVAIGDTFDVKYSDTSVYMLHNDVVKHTFATTAGQTMYIDSSFREIGSSVDNVYFGGSL